MLPCSQMHHSPCNRPNMAAAPSACLDGHWCWLSLRSGTTRDVPQRAEITHRQTTQQGQGVTKGTAAFQVGSNLYQGLWPSIWAIGWWCESSWLTKRGLELATYWKHDLQKWNEHSSSIYSHLYQPLTITKNFWEKCTFSSPACCRTVLRPGVRHTPFSALPPPFYPQDWCTLSSSSVQQHPVV